MTTAINPGFAIMVHERHQRRMANYELIFKAFEVDEFSIADIAELVALSMAGARKYVYELASFGLVNVVNPVRATSNTPVIYSLTQSQPDLQAFSEMMKEGMPGDPRSERKKPAPKEKKAKKVKVAKPEKSKVIGKVHLLLDAHTLTHRPEIVEVRRHWMDFALFGNGPAPSLVGSI